MLTHMYSSLPAHWPISCLNDKLSTSLDILVKGAKIDGLRLLEDEKEK